MSVADILASATRIRNEMDNLIRLCMDHQEVFEKKDIFSKTLMPRHITADDALTAVSTITGFSKEDLLTPGRRQSHQYANARHLALYVMNKWAHVSRSELARQFQMDPSSITYAIDKIFRHGNRKDHLVAHQLETLKTVFEKMIGARTA